MTSRTNHAGGDYYSPYIRSGFKLAFMTKNATAEMAIGANWPPILYLDPAGGAKTILLPAEAECAGQVFIIVNTADAAETITVEEDSSTTSIGTVAQNTSGMFHCDGTAWTKIVL